MHHLRILAYLAWSIWGSALYATPLQQEIDTLIEQSLPHATIGVMIKDAQSGEILYARNTNKFLSPASNIKLLTAASALYYLGAEDKYITSLSQDKQHFYLSFSGSPALKTEDLKTLLGALNPLGIHTISGNIFLDTSAFQPPFHSPGASYDDLAWYFEAPSTALILNENAAHYDFISAKKTGSPIEIKSINSDSPLSLINEVQTATLSDEKNHCGLNIDIQENNTLRLYGCIALDTHPKRMALAIPNPNVYAKNIIKKILTEYHIDLQGQVLDGQKPMHAKLIATHQSDPLKKLITHMLVESDNLYADSLTKRLGRALTGQGTYKQGAYAIKKILKDHTHLDMHQIALSDGQGTRYNLITPEQLMILLTDLYLDETIQPILLSALPHMGVSGTLKDRMKKTPLENNVLAKTGSMHDISALSGYLLMPKGKTIIFTIISNGIHDNLIKAKELEDNILLTVYNRLNDDASHTDTLS